MADFLTHSLSYTKEDINSLFVEPFFSGDDVISMLDVMTNVNYNLALNQLNLPSGITRSGSSTGFTDATGATITQKTLTMIRAKAEWGANRMELWDTIYQEALRQQIPKEDVLEMSPVDVYTKLFLPAMGKLINKDYLNGIWFGDAKYKTLSGSVPNAYPTTSVNSADEHLTLYSGLWTRIFAAINDGTIASSQIVSVTNTATKGKEVGTLTISSGTITVTINGVGYSEAYDTDAATTIANWMSSHQATIEALYNEEQKVVCSNSTNTLTIEAKNKGADLDVTWAASTGSWSVVDTDATKQSDLSSGDALSYLQQLESSVSSDAYDYLDQFVFFVSNSMYLNYLNSLSSTGTSEGAYITLQNGKKILQYHGYPVIPVRQFDTIVSSKLNSVFRHRAIFAYPKTFVVGSNGAADGVETWWENKDEKRYFRSSYLVGTQIRSEKLITVAY